MSTAVPPLPGLLAFESSARHLSFAAAAAELHLSPSAISQRVRVLERHLGTPLFERRPRSLRLTTAGEAYLPAIRDIFDDLSAATSGVFGQVGRTTLTIRAQVSYATTWLAPRLARFTTQHPHIDVHLTSSIWTDTLSPSESDLEIRQGTGRWSGFHATHLHDDHAVAVHGHGYTEKHRNEPWNPMSHPRVQVLGFDDVWRRFAAARPDQTTAPPAVIIVDTSVAALQIVATSDLWTIVPERFARPSVRTGQLIRPAGPTIPMRQSHYLLRREGVDRNRGESLAFERWLHAENADEETL